MEALGLEAYDLARMAIGQPPQNFTKILLADQAMGGKCGGYQGGGGGLWWFGGNRTWGWRKVPTSTKFAST